MSGSLPSFIVYGTADPAFGLSNMTDVNVGTPSEGDILIYGTATETWGTIPGTAFVGTAAPVTSVFGRVGAVVAGTNDYTWAQINKGTSDIADITTRSHTSLTDIGTLSHGTIDAHLTRLLDTSGTNTGDAVAGDGIAVGTGQVISNIDKGSDALGSHTSAYNHSLFLTSETDPVFTAWDKDHNDLINNGTVSHSTLDSHVGSVNPHIDWTNATASFYTTNSGTYAGTLQIGTGSNYVTIDNVDGVRLYGSATTWDDLRVPITSTKVSGTATEPTFTKVLSYGGTSTGVFGYQFSASRECEVFFNAQLPHTWRAGGYIYPHVHWIHPGTNTTSVIWGLEYTWDNYNSTLGTSTSIIYATATPTGTVNATYLTSLGSIDGTGKVASSMILCRFFRNVSAAAGSPVVTDFDFHYEIDSLGGTTLP